MHSPYLKKSRKHGQIELVGYASGDGSISFSWRVAGKSVEEPVTESDASEWLAANGEAFRGWDVCELGVVDKFLIPVVRLTRTVSRPKGSSRILLMDGVEYVYYCSSDNPEGQIHYRPDNTRFRRSGSPSVEENSSELVLSLCFFLNNEEWIKR